MAQPTPSHPFHSLTSSTLAAAQNRPSTVRPSRASRRSTMKAPPEEKGKRSVATTHVNICTYACKCTECTQHHLHPEHCAAMLHLLDGIYLTICLHGTAASPHLLPDWTCPSPHPLAAAPRGGSSAALSPEHRRMASPVKSCILKTQVAFKFIACGAWGDARIIA